MKRSRSPFGSSQPTRLTDKRRKTTKSERVTGRVRSSKTTLAKSATPFPPVRWVTFEYRNGLVSRVPVSLEDVVSYGCNDIFDFDRTTGFLGNKQPLFYDDLLSSVGPYKQFRVLSWVTTFTIINRGAAPITMWLCPPHISASDIDTAFETDALPGVIKKFVDVTGGMSMVSITSKGHMKDVYAGYINDSNLTGTSASSPGTTVFGALVLRSTATLSYEIAVEHHAYTQLTGLDAQSS